MTRVAVLGAKGRMGSASSTAIEAAEGLELVAGIDVGDDLDVITGAGAQAALVFTTPDVAFDQARWCLERGIHAVIGTSGFGDDKVRELEAVVRAHDGVGALVVPNFSIGAVLMMRFAGIAAPFFESVEVIEMHHPDKVDAPSGTARHTAAAIASARADAGLGPSPDATQDGWDARGADVDGVRVHAVRLRGLVAHEEILFGNAGEQLTIRQDSFDRASFMPGVLVAVREITSRPGLTVGLENVLDLS